MTKDLYQRLQLTTRKMDYLINGIGRITVFVHHRMTTIRSKYDDYQADVSLDTNQPTLVETKLDWIIDGIFTRCSL